VRRREDVSVTMSNAFDAARRQLQDVVGKRQAPGKGV
jgi:hypothetical protein